MVRVLKTIYLVLLLVLAGCVLQSQVKISLVDRPVVDSSAATLSTVSVVNDQLVLSGAGLDKVTSIRLTGPSLDQTLSIESKNSGSLIANGTANLSLLVGGLFNLIISDASGAATYQVTFTLQNGAVTGSKISQMGAATGDVLGWNGTTWAPQPSVDSGLLFMGAWDAVSALPAGSAGEYYIADTSNYYDFGAGPEYVRAGDWALYAGASWTHVDKSSGVLKVFGRTGEVTAVEGDISSLDLIGNVNTAGAANGKILKYNGSAWVVGDDLTAAAGSIGSAEITDGSVADTDLAGSISQAKITNLVSDLAGKEATITAGTTAQFYRGDKSWQDFAATVLGTPITGYALGANTPISGTDTVLAAFGKIQGQITSGYLSGVSSNIQTQLDSKLSVESDPSVYLFAKSQLPTCLPGEVLSESLGAFTCVTDATGPASEWVTTGSDIYRSSGYVGIGTNAPTADLMINALSGSMHTITRLRNQASSAGAGLRLVFSHLTVDSAAISEQLIDGTNNSDLFFSTRGTNVLTEKMRITASGNVGIGSTTPTAKLDITGNIRIVDGTQGANKVLTSDTNGYASWQALPGGGDALTTGKLSQFAATSSAELAGVISDESGTGALLFAGSPAMTGTPTAPTAAGGTNTTQIATTAFVAGEVSSKQASDATLTALAGYNTNGIMVQTAADTFTGRSVIGTLNRVSVTNGSGVLGDPTINIDPTLFPSPVAANLVLRSTGTDASTWQTLDTAMVNESASYLYFTEGRVLGTDLLGLSLASSADVTSADTVLSAIGKLQNKTDTLESNGQWLVNTTHIYRSSGNVGIGTATPSAMLTVNGNALFGANTGVGTTTPINVSFGGTYGTNTPGNQGNLKWDLYNAAGTNRYGIGMSAGLMEFQAGSNSDGNFAWYTGSATEQMRLTTAGNLGIGTSSPASKLEIAGGTNATVLRTVGTAVGTNWSGRIVAGGPSNVFLMGQYNNQAWLGAHNAALSSWAPFYINPDGTQDLFLGDSDGITATNTPIVTIRNSTGQVGIGTATPSATFEVAGQVKITGGTPGLNKVLTSDAAGLASWTTLPSAPVTSVNTQTGAVVLTATNIGSSATGTVAATNVQTAIAELESEKQGADAGLGALATYNTNGILVQSADNTFVGRSIAGTANRTSVTNGDGVAGNPTINIDTTLLPSPIAGDAGKFLKASGANASAWSSLASGDITTALGFTPVNKAGDSIASGTFDFNGASVVRVLDPILPTDVVNRQYVDQYGQWVKNGTDIYRSAGNVGIGTDTPIRTLDVNGIIKGDAFQMFKDGSDTVGSGPYYGMYKADVTKGWLQQLSASNNMDFWYFDGAAWAQKMTLSSTGALGIGTVTPGATLNIGGNGDMRFDSDGLGTAIDWKRPADTNKFARIFLGGGGGASDMRFFTRQGVFTADTAPVASMMIQGTTGYVGIGTTNPLAQLHVNNSSNTSTTADNAGLYVTSDNRNGYLQVDGNASWASSIVMSAGLSERGRIAYGHTTNSMTFHTNAGGVAGAGERLRIDSAGNVGIGTASPSELLSVYNATSAYLSVANATHKLYMGADVNQPWLGTQTNSSLRIVTNAIERVRVNSTGEVGIGTVSPGSLLDIKKNVADGTGVNVLRATDSAGQFRWRVDQYFDMYMTSGAGAETMIIKNSGDIGIGTTTPSYKLDVQGGDINASGSVRAAGVALTSDQRFKREIATVEDPVEKLLDLRGVTYYWRDQDFPERHFDQKLHYGFIAQEIEQVVPEVVNTDSKGFKSVEYANITSILVEGFKVVWEKILTLFAENREQDRAIASIKEENQKLKDENQKLKERLDRIERLLHK